MIRLKLSEHYCIILFILPSANNFQVEEKVVNPRRTGSFGDQFQTNPLFGHCFYAVRFCIVFRVFLFCIILNLFDLFCLSSVAYFFFVFFCFFKCLYFSPKGRYKIDLNPPGTVKELCFSLRVFIFTANTQQQVETKNM